MTLLTTSYVERLKSCGVKIIESHLHDINGYVVIADIVHCSNGADKHWHEEHPVTLRGNKSVIEYLLAIS